MSCCIPTPPSAGYAIPSKLKGRNEQRGERVECLKAAIQSDEGSVAPTASSIKKHNACDTQSHQDVAMRSTAGWRTAHTIASRTHVVRLNCGPTCIGQSIKPKRAAGTEKLRHGSLAGAGKPEPGNAQKIRDEQHCKKSPSPDQPQSRKNPRLPYLGPFYWPRCRPLAAGSQYRRGARQGCPAAPQGCQAA